MTATLLPADASPHASPEPSHSSSGNAAIATTLALRPEVWRPLVRFREDTRWTGLLEPSLLREVLGPSLHADLAEAEVWLLSWVPGQGTALHDHGPSAGAFAVAQGALTERVVGAAAGAAARTRSATSSASAGSATSAPATSTRSATSAPRPP